MAAEVSSRLAACSSVRCDRSVVLVEISAEALVTSRPEFLILPMVSLTFCAISCDRLGDLTDFILAAEAGNRDGECRRRHFRAGVPGRAAAGQS